MPCPGFLGCISTWGPSLPNPRRTAAWMKGITETELEPNPYLRGQYKVVEPKFGFWLCVDSQPSVLPLQNEPKILD